MSEYTRQSCLNLAATLVNAALADLTGSESDQAAIMLARQGLCSEDVPALIERMKNRTFKTRAQVQVSEMSDFLAQEKETL